MQTSQQKIENYLKDFLYSEPAISKKETDRVSKDVTISLKKDLSDIMFQIIADIMSPTVVKAILQDYVLKFKG